MAKPADVRPIASPRTGAKRSVLGVVRQLPRYLKMLYGLMRDPHVSRIDRALVVLAAAYIVLPLDFIPDVIPFLGEVDDVFLLVLALQHLVNRAGRAALERHWPGDPEVLRGLHFGRVLSAAAFFLPGRIRKRLEKLIQPAA